VSCHDQGGARARPRWTESAPMACGDCHGSPPASHFPGPCNQCHAEADARGTALTPGPLHMNGRVDLGDGSGSCAACHGKNGDPWPRTNAHPAHEVPTLTRPVDCANCHPVPTDVLAPGHLDGTVQIAFGGRALDRGAQPTWSGGACASVACHGANLVDTPAVLPTWTDSSHSASACGACHGVPPSQHTPSTSCDRSSCHGTETFRNSDGSPAISVTGRALHIDGTIESGP
jgi:hypothetical protein